MCFELSLLFSLISFVYIRQICTKSVAYILNKSDIISNFKAILRTKINDGEEKYINKKFILVLKNAGENPKMLH